MAQMGVGFTSCGCAHGPPKAGKQQTPDMGTQYPFTSAQASTVNAGTSSRKSSATCGFWKEVLALVVGGIAVIVILRALD